MPQSVPPIHVLIPVWGEAYTRCFVQIGLPSLLAPGNLPALKREAGHLIHVYTTPQDRDALLSSPAWERARDFIDLRLDLIGPELNVPGHPHLTMSNCHREAIAFAGTRDAAMMFFNPDIVLADGGMRTLVGLLEQGKRAIQVIGLRLLKEAVVPILLERHSSNDGTRVTLTSRELMAIAMKHLHPLTKMHLYDATDLDLMPQEVFWRAGDEGIVARCFHIHPILVYPRVRNAPFTTTVDDDYLRAACPDHADEHVIADSDEFCLCELSAMQRGVTGLPRADTDVDIARWAWVHGRPHHFEHFCRRIVLHAGRSSEAEWEAACVRSDEGVARILDAVLQMAAQDRAAA